MTATDTRTTATPTVRGAALAAPLLLFAYGICRWIDGFDGDRHNGPAWDIGHTLFLLGIVGFAVLAVALRRVFLSAAGRQSGGWRIAVEVATAATLLGAAAFGWVIVGDLFEPVADTVPDPVFDAGPVLFQLGLLTLLVRAVTVRLLPAWAPVLVLVGFVALAVDLDLLPVGAALVAVGLLPLALGVRRGR
ncbi:hypothetical protein [Micromonospora sp. CPCC 205556]|uniref:hypothetical protein n=1 Tax=Micromonospora sp. CPCC 205556 TaxID=3122398 RepID=UPI002FF39897